MTSSRGLWAQVRRWDGVQPYPAADSPPQAPSGAGEQHRLAEAVLHTPPLSCGGVLAGAVVCSAGVDGPRRPSAANMRRAVLCEAKQPPPFHRTRDLSETAQRPPSCVSNKRSGVSGHVQWWRWRRSPRVHVSCTPTNTSLGE